MKKVITGALTRFWGSKENSPQFKLIKSGPDGSPKESVLEIGSANIIRSDWTHRTYGDGTQPMFGTETYEKPLNWLLETCDTIEDWGCGMCWGRQYVPEGRYKGVDGSPAAEEFADVICDLRDYKSKVDGVFMRHILEHNWDWPIVLRNAMDSFEKRFVLILFTPFTLRTRAIQPFGLIDMAFAKEDITAFFEGCEYRLESLETNTQYGVEHIFYIERI